MAQSQAGKGAVKALMKNPAARRIAAKGIKKAAMGAVSAYQSLQPKKGVEPNPAVQSLPAEFPAAGLKAVSSPGSVVESVAQPWAEKLAETSAGRSVLQALHSVSGEALRTTAPKSFVSVLAANASVKPAEVPQPNVGFTPLQAPKSGAPPNKAVKWPPEPEGG